MSEIANSVKIKYRNYCLNTHSIPLFCRDWWLDAVCGEQNWDVVVVERGGNIVGVLPYYTRKKFGLKIIHQPKLTQFMGPWLVYPKGQKNHARISFEKEILSELISSLPPCDGFMQCFHYSSTNWLPFYWNGFKQTTRYTYVIENIDNVDEVFSNFRSNIKTDIKKASKFVDVSCTDSIEEFYALNKLTFERQGVSIPYDMSFLIQIDMSCAKRDCRRIYIARDKVDSSVHAAIYIVWDENSAYYLMGGGNPSLRNSGATSLLLWEAIQYVSTRTKQFDFEGSMIEPIERFNRAFGAKQLPYSCITKYNFKMRFLFALKCLYDRIYDK